VGLMIGVDTNFLKVNCLFMHFPLKMALANGLTCSLYQIPQACCMLNKCEIYFFYVYRL
jgi:hypothetical protein